MDQRTKWSLALLLVVAAPVAAAPGDEPESQLFETLYGDGGTTLYCHDAFTARDEVAVDRVYRSSRLLDYFQCDSVDQCRQQPEFRQAWGDLHNLFPVRERIALRRRDKNIGSLPGQVEAADSSCAYKISMQTFAPPKEVRGDVARVVIYMHKTYGVPLVRSLTSYKRWNRADPPDDRERARNDAIASGGGDRNPYIDNPDQMDDLRPASKRLQFGP